MNRPEARSIVLRIVLVLALALALWPLARAADEGMTAPPMLAASHQPCHDAAPGHDDACPACPAHCLGLADLALPAPLTLDGRVSRVRLVPAPDAFGPSRIPAPGLRPPNALV